MHAFVQTKSYLNENFYEMSEYYTYAPEIFIGKPVSSSDDFQNYMIWTALTLLRGM